MRAHRYSMCPPCGEYAAGLGPARPEASNRGLQVTDTNARSVAKAVANEKGVLRSVCRELPPSRWRMAGAHVSSRDSLCAGVATLDEPTRFAQP